MGGGWGGGGVVEASCRTFTIVTGSKNHEKWCIIHGGKKIVIIRWVVGGVGVRWQKTAAGPLPLQRAQKIVKNDVSYMGVKPLIVTLSTPVKICKLLQSCKSLKLPSAQLEERGRKKRGGGWPEQFPIVLLMSRARFKWDLDISLPLLWTLWHLPPLP